MKKIILIFILIFNSLYAIDMNLNLNLEDLKKSKENPLYFYEEGLAEGFYKEQYANFFSQIYEKRDTLLKDKYKAVKIDVFVDLVSPEEQCYQYENQLTIDKYGGNLLMKLGFDYNEKTQTYDRIFSKEKTYIDCELPTENECFSNPQTNKLTFKECKEQSECYISTKKNCISDLKEKQNQLILNIEDDFQNMYSKGYEEYYNLLAQNKDNLKVLGDDLEEVMENGEIVLQRAAIEFHFNRNAKKVKVTTKIDRDPTYISTPQESNVLNFMQETFKNQVFKDKDNLESELSGKWKDNGDNLDLKKRLIEYLIALGYRNIPNVMTSGKKSNITFRDSTFFYFNPIVNAKSNGIQNGGTFAPLNKEEIKNDFINNVLLNKRAEILKPNLYDHPIYISLQANTGSSHGRKPTFNTPIEMKKINVSNGSNLLTLGELYKNGFHTEDQSCSTDNCNITLYVYAEGSGVGNLNLNTTHKKWSSGPLGTYEIKTTVFKTNGKSSEKISYILDDFGILLPPKGLVIEQKYQHLKGLQLILKNDDRKKGMSGYDSLYSILLSLYKYNEMIKKAQAEKLTKNDLRWRFDYKKYEKMDDLQIIEEWKYKTFINNEKIVDLKKKALIKAESRKVFKEITNGVDVMDLPTFKIQTKLTDFNIKMRKSIPITINNNVLNYSKECKPGELYQNRIFEHTNICFDISVNSTKIEDWDLGKLQSQRKEVPFIYTKSSKILKVKNYIQTKLNSLSELKNNEEVRRMLECVKYDYKPISDQKEFIEGVFYCDNNKKEKYQILKKEVIGGVKPGTSPEDHKMIMKMYKTVPNEDIQKCISSLTKNKEQILTFKDIKDPTTLEYFRNMTKTSFKDQLRLYIYDTGKTANIQKEYRDKIIREMKEHFNPFVKNIREDSEKNLFLERIENKMLKNFPFVRLNDITETINTAYLDDSTKEKTKEIINFSKEENQKYTTEELDNYIINDFLNLKLQRYQKSTDSYGEREVLREDGTTYKISDTKYFYNLLSKNVFKIKCESDDKKSCIYNNLIPQKCKNKKYTEFTESEGGFIFNIKNKETEIGSNIDSNCNRYTNKIFKIYTSEDIHTTKNQLLISVSLPNEFSVIGDFKQSDDIKSILGCQDLELKEEYNTQDKKYYEYVQCVNNSRVFASKNWKIVEKFEKEDKTEEEEKLELIFEQPINYLQLQKKHLTPEEKIIKKYKHKKLIKVKTEDNSDNVTKLGYEFIENEDINVLDFNNDNLNKLIKVDQNINETTKKIKLKILQTVGSTFDSLDKPENITTKILLQNEKYILSEIEIKLEDNKFKYKATGENYISNVDNFYNIYKLDDKMVINKINENIILDATEFEKEKYLYFGNLKNEYKLNIESLGNNREDNYEFNELLMGEYILNYKYNLNELHNKTKKNISEIENMCLRLSKLDLNIRGQILDKLKLYQDMLNFLIDPLPGGGMNGLLGSVDKRLSTSGFGVGYLSQNSVYEKWKRKLKLTLKGFKWKNDTAFTRQLYYTYYNRGSSIVNYIKTVRGGKYKTFFEDFTISDGKKINIKYNKFLPTVFPKIYTGFVPGTAECKSFPLQFFSKNCIISKKKRESIASDIIMKLYEHRSHFVKQILGLYNMLKFKKCTNSFQANGYFDMDWKDINIEELEKINNEYKRDHNKSILLNTNETFDFKINKYSRQNPETNFKEYKYDLIQKGNINSQTASKYCYQNLKKYVPIENSIFEVPTFKNFFGASLQDGNVYMDRLIKKHQQIITYHPDKIGSPCKYYTGNYPKSEGFAYPTLEYINGEKRCVIRRIIKPLYYNINNESPNIYQQSTCKKGMANNMVCAYKNTCEKGSSDVLGYKSDGTAICKSTNHLIKGYTSNISSCVNISFSLWDILFRFHKIIKRIKKDFESIVFEKRVGCENEEYNIKTDHIDQKSISHVYMTKNNFDYYMFETINFENMTTDSLTGLKKALSSYDEISEQLMATNKDVIDSFEQGTEIDQIVSSCLDFKGEYVYEYPKESAVFSLRDREPFKRFKNYDKEYQYEYTNPKTGKVLQRSVRFCDEIYNLNTEELYDQQVNYNMGSEDYYNNEYQKSLKNASENMAEYLFPSITNKEKVMKMTSSELKSCGLTKMTEEKWNKELLDNNKLMSEHESCIAKLDAINKLKTEKLKMMEKVNAFKTEESTTNTVISPDGKISEELKLEKEGSADFLIPSDSKSKIGDIDLEKLSNEIISMDLSTLKPDEEVGSFIQKNLEEDGKSEQEQLDTLLKMTSKKISEKTEPIIGALESVSKILSIYAPTISTMTKTASTALDIGTTVSKVQTEMAKSKAKNKFLNEFNSAKGKYKELDSYSKEIKVTKRNNSQIKDKQQLALEAAKQRKKLEDNSNRVKKLKEINANTVRDMYGGDYKMLNGYGNNGLTMKDLEDFRNKRKEQVENMTTGKEATQNKIEMSDKKILDEDKDISKQMEDIKTNVSKKYQQNLSATNRNISLTKSKEAEELKNTKKIQKNTENITLEEHSDIFEKTKISKDDVHAKKLQEEIIPFIK